MQSRSLLGSAARVALTRISHNTRPSSMTAALELTASEDIRRFNASRRTLHNSPCPIIAARR